MSSFEYRLCKIFYTCSYLGTKRAKEKFSKSISVNEVQGGHFREEELSQSLIEQYEVEFKTLQVQIKDTYSNLKDKLQNMLDQAFEEEHQRLVSDVRW